jgi:transposase
MKAPALRGRGVCCASGRRERLGRRRRAEVQFIAFDSHKRYTQACVETKEGGRLAEVRVPHDRGALREFLGFYEPGSPVAVETIGNWYWIVDEIEQAGMSPKLVHARKAKLMMGMVNKTDKLDARGLNLLQRNGTLPTVWIPPAELRDKRDLARTRMVLVRQRTMLKNRIQATLAKYAASVTEVSDTFGVRGRKVLAERLRELPEQTRFATEKMLEELDSVVDKVEAFEARIKEVFEETPEVKLLRTLPGVGLTLSVVISQEVGDIGRFASAERFASYSGVVPRVQSSGGKTRYGGLREDVNQYLKWAFVEAANAVVLQRRNYPTAHVSRLYERLKHHKAHGKAIGAVARHLAEAAYWMLTKKEEYREPKRAKNDTVSSTKA